MMYTRYVVKILLMYKGSRIATNLYYLEIEAWLSRMESWQARLRPVGATQDILEQQSREVKVMCRSKGSGVRVSKNLLG